jgi:branched-chain amino acid transport system ATP-binding protein
VRTVSQGPAADCLGVEGVSVQFDGVVALDAVSLRLERGEILGLIGPNGAGKTTLLNVLSGFQRPHAGSVSCRNRDVTRARPGRLVREWGGRTRQGAATATAWRLLELFGLTDRADDMAGGLPHGEERLLGIARALASSPDFLLLDEPGAGMNWQEGEQLVARIQQIRSELGCAVLIVEHDMQLIMSLSERIHVLDYGRTLSEGTPAEVRSDPEVVRAYFGTDKFASHARG